MLYRCWTNFVHQFPTELVSTNPPPIGQKRSKGGSVCTVLKSVSPQDRVRKFADDSLCVSAGKLFCRACRGTEKERRQESCPINEHKPSKSRLKEKEKRDADIADALQRYSKQVSKSIVRQHSCVPRQNCSGVLTSWYSTTKNRQLP